MSAGLKATIEHASRDALKHHDGAVLSTLRMALSAMKNREIEKRAKTGMAEEMTEEEVLIVVRSEAKKRRDAIAEFEKAGRHDLVDKESRELAILEKYLPIEMPDEEIEKLLQPVLVAGVSMADFGRIMGAAMKAVAGRASGDRVSAIVRRLLEVRN